MDVKRIGPAKAGLTGGGGRAGRVALALCLWAGACAALHAEPAEPPPEDDLPALRRQLYSSDPFDRMFAAATLLERERPEALQAVNDVLTGANDQMVRLSILEALDRRRDRRFIGALLGLLGDRDEKVSQRAAAVLGRFADHAVVEDLARLVRDPRTGEMAQLAAIEALVRTEQKDAVGVLIDLLNSAHKSVQASALAALRGVTLVDLGENPDAWARWWRLNRDKTRFQWGAHLVHELRQQVDELRKRYETVRRDAVRWARAYEARLTDGKERTAFLKELIASDYPELRIHAAGELPKIKEAEGVLEALVPVLADRDARVVAAATAGLGELRNPKAVPGLTALLKRDEPLARAAACRALGRLKAGEAAKDLLPLLQDREEDVRLAATEALGLLEAAEAFDGLVARLADESAVVRVAAVSAVANLRDERGAGPLIAALLGDKELRVRFFAARALADYPGKAVDDALVKALADADPGVREAAAVSLGRRTDPALIDPLITGALDDESASVRQKAWASALALLEKAKGPGAVDRASTRLMAEKAYGQAAQALEAAEPALAAAGPEDAALVARLRRRLADAYVLVENWTRAAAVYRVLLAAGDASVEAPLVTALEKSGDFLAAAQVHLSAAVASPAHRTKRLAAAIGLAERAHEARRPQAAVAILQRLRRSEKEPLEAALEQRLTTCAAAATAAWDQEADAATPRVRELLELAAGSDATAAQNAAAELVRLGLLAAPALLEGLADSSVPIRAAAITALRSVSGTQHGFNPAGPDAEREAAIGRWRAWVDSQRTVPKAGA